MKSLSRRHESPKKTCQARFTQRSTLQSGSFLRSPWRIGGTSVVSAQLLPRTPDCRQSLSTTGIPEELASPSEASRRQRSTSRRLLMPSGGVGANQDALHVFNRRSVGTET